MSSIRVLTYNIQAQATPAPTSDQAVARAQAVVAALHTPFVPPIDQPDIIAFNEADNEDAKDVLVDGLSALYPHHFSKFVHNTFALNDSGLAIFSKFPFKELPPHSHNSSDNRYRFFPYDRCAHHDCLMEKGVALLQVSTEMELEVVTIAITHMQAYYDHVGQHSRVRRSQLQTIESALTELLGPPSSNSDWAKVIVMGDMNIRGDVSTGLSNEWGQTFQLRPGIFSSALVDGWRTYLSPPGADQEKDPGTTNYNLSAGKNLPSGLKARLDYICPPNRNRFPSNSPALVPHYMRLFPVGGTDLDQAYRRVNSDHKALFAELHWDFPHSTPHDAILQGTSDFHMHQDPHSHIPIHVATLEIRSQGAYQWAYIAEPGTYTFNAPLEDLDMHFFLEDDLSTPIGAYDNVLLSTLGFDRNWIGDIVHEFKMSERGRQVYVSKPVFVRFRGGLGAPNFRGSFHFSYIKHTGETPGLAIRIAAWDTPKNPMLPYGRPNGSADECWFLALIDGKLESGRDHNSRFYLKNRARKDAKVMLFHKQDPHNPIQVRDGNQAEIALDLRTDQDIEVYFMLQRSAKSDVEFEVGWKSEITYLDANNLSLKCVVETSGGGSDEIRIKLFADDLADPFMDTLLLGFDESEIQSLSPGFPARDIAFQHKIRVVIFEEDDIDPDDGPFTMELPALSFRGSNPSSKTAMLSRSKEIIVDDGKYLLEYGLRRSSTRHR